VQILARALVFLAAWTLFGATWAAPYFEPRISVDVERKQDAVEVDSHVLLPVESRVVWDVLTDYNRIASFVPGLTMSRLVSGPGEPKLLEQRGQIDFALFQFDIEVVARVYEQPYHTIRFEAVRGNMREMRGEWNVDTLGDNEGSRLHYRLHVVPGFWVPPVVGPALIRRNFRDQFESLTREMMRRSSHQAGIESP
jgi:ribosome-associated toxin RatA of RatAB toxin-antitoxin module